MSSLKKFIIQFSHFFTGSALSILLGFITFPILTRILTKEQYGIMGLVTTTMLLAVAVGKAGLSDGIIRHYKEYSDTAERRIEFSSTVLIRGVIISVIAVLLYLGLFPIISYYLKIDEQYTTCFKIMAAYLFIRPINILVLNILRVNYKTISYNVIGLVGKIISIGLSLFLLLFVLQGLYGYFIGVILAEYIVSFYLLYWYFKNFKVVLSKVSRELTLKLIKFGLPILFTEISFLLLSFADRYMIVAYHGEAVLGVYTVGYNLAMYIGNIIAFSISYAVLPIYVDIYSKEGKLKTEYFLQRSMHYVLIMIIPLFFGYLALSKDLFNILTSGKYIEAASFSPFILLSVFFLGVNNILNAGLYLKKKTMTILFIMLIALAINIIMNIILLPDYGVMGATIATLVAYVVSTLLMVILSFRYIVVRVDAKAFFYYVLLSAFMYYVVINIGFRSDWLTIIIKIIVGVLLIASGVLSKEREIRIRVLNSLRLKIV